LNLKHPELVEESDLENALINQLQEFIMELGNGFCFESRQKRILIGDEYFFIDLVFYHRILKCHVLIELKTEKVNHEHIGQLKTYINYYKKNYTLPNDNPPVGILLVTTQNKTLVEYAIADSDKDIFVSQYLLQLPDKEQLVTFINEELKKLEQ
jgi:RecB family endonuclease NucS